MARPTNEFVTLATSDRILEVAFLWRGDRFGHSWRIAGNANPHIVAISGESDPTEPWPVQPVIQELQKFQDPEGTTVLAGVGKTPHAYWSLTARPWRSDQMEIDIACRTSAIPRFLGSTYAIPSGGTLAFEIDERDSNDRCDIVTSPGEWTCAVRTIDSPAPRTYRWRYRAVRI